MTIALREDVMYILLDKIGSANGAGKQQVDFMATDFTGRELTAAGLLGHLDFLNQRGYINADFSGNAYANQEDVPNAVELEPVDLRVANTLGASDGPLPHLIQFERAELTDKGKKMLEKMEANQPDSLSQGPVSPIATENQPFLEKIAIRAELEDIFDARDIAEVVFRTMRDLMTTQAADRVAGELRGEDAVPSDDKSLQDDIADLWQDTNPIVGFLSRIRPPLNFDDEAFLRRIRQEGGLQRGVSPEKAVSAVFAATKEELSAERNAEIAEALPGEVRRLWESA